MGNLSENGKLKNENGKCTGLIFRYRESQYAGDGQVTAKHQLYVLRKQSCKCLACAATLEMFEEYVNCGEFPFMDSFEDDFIDRQTYKLIICSWCEDEFEVSFKEIKKDNEGE